MFACPDCGREHALDAGDLVRCECAKAPLLAYCGRCDAAVRAERAGDRRLCTACGRALPGCQRCRVLLACRDGAWSCPACRLPASACAHQKGSERCGELVTIESGHARCTSCGRTSAVCPDPECRGLIPLLDGLQALDCPTCEREVFVCSNRHCRQVFRPGVESATAACPSCGESLLACPTPGCDGVVAAASAGHCDRCGEAYRLCRQDRCLTANSSLANYCRLCGAPLAGPDPVPAPPVPSSLDFRHRNAGWVELPEDFEPRLAPHVRGLVAGGRAFFALPSGAILAAAHDPLAGEPAVALARAFAPEDFARKDDILVFGLSSIAVPDGARRHRHVLATSWRRVVAIDVLDPSRVVEIADVRRYHGPTATLVGPPIVRGAHVVVAARRGGDSPGLAIDRFELSTSPGGRLEARRAGGRVQSTAEKSLIGPVEIWDGRAAVVGERTIFTFDLAPERNLESTELPVHGDGGVLVTKDAVPGASLVDPEIVFLPGNPRFAADRLVFFGADGAGPREGKTYSFYELGREAGRAPRLVQTVRGITENQVRFTPLVRRGALHLLFLWRRNLHLFDVVGGLKDLELDAAFDPAGGPTVHGDHVACRLEGANAVVLLRIEEQGRNLRLAHAATLDLGPAPAIGPPLFDGSRVHTLHVDPKRPRRLGVGRGELRTPAPV